MSSNWGDLSEGKVKRNIIRERLEQKRKERQDNSSESHNILEGIKAEPVEDTKLGLDIKQEHGKQPIELDPSTSTHKSPF